MVIVKTIIIWSSIINMLQLTAVKYKHFTLIYNTEYNDGQIQVLVRLIAGKKAETDELEQGGVPNLPGSILGLFNVGSEALLCAIAVIFQAVLPAGVEVIRYLPWNFQFSLIRCFPLFTTLSDKLIFYAKLLHSSTSYGIFFTISSHIFYNVFTMFFIAVYVNILYGILYCQTFKHIKVHCKNTIHYMTLIPNHH